MTRGHPPLPLIVVFLVLAVVVGGYWGFQRLGSPTEQPLTASGTIEAVTIGIAPELGGKVVEVYVDEGDAVRAGEPLFRLDDGLLQAQRRAALAALEVARAAVTTAEATLAAAQANDKLTQNAVHAEAAPSRTADWGAAFVALMSQAEEIAAARAEVEAAYQAREAAQKALTAALNTAAAADFVAAEERLLRASLALTVTGAVLERATAAAAPDLREAAQTAYDEARTEFEEARAVYDELQQTGAAQTVLTARANLTVAEERYQAAQDRLLSYQIGPYSPRLTAAQATVRQAEAAAEQARLAVAQAEANLALVDAQIAKLIVVAPADGVILSRLIQPGEVLAAGATAFKLGRLDELFLTVYVPEDRYGRLILGQTATVTVDSFPDDRFTATVMHIADRAEFTPRNVQTVEGRSTTVFAVRLRIVNPEGKLKPGMPADVVF